MGNPWFDHLSKVRKENPSLSLKDLCCAYTLKTTKKLIVKIIVLFFIILLTGTSVGLS